MQRVSRINPCDSKGLRCHSALKARTGIITVFRPVLQPLRPYKADDLLVVVRAVERQHKQIGVSVRCKVGNDLFRWDTEALALEQSIPRIFRVRTAAGSTLNFVSTTSPAPQHDVG